jgi:hypothetical protein
MEEAKDYKKYLKGLKEATTKKLVNPRKVLGIRGLKNIQGLLVGRSALKKRTGGAMLKNPGKADLDKDGKLSGYEKKRGMAIEKAMGAKRGKFAKTRRQGIPALPDKEFDTYNKMRDAIDTQRKMQERKKQMEKDKQKISEKKKGIAVKSGGMMKYNKGGGADTGKEGELKSRIGVATNKLKRVNRMLKTIGGRKAPKRPKLQAPERGPMKPLKAKIGKAVKKDPRTRDERVKKAFPKKSPRGQAVISTLFSQNPMKRDRLREGAKARRRKMFTDALRKLGAAGRSLTPAGAAGPIARKIGENISKKMGGGMMMKPMGYKSGTSVMARGCKLGRKKATKIM